VFCHVGVSFEALQTRTESLPLQMLNENGYPDHGPLEDIGTTQEKELGKIIKKLHGTDFYSLTEFPAGVAPSFIRPFYTMLSPKDSNLTNSFDVFMRGEVRPALCLLASLVPFKGDPSTASKAMVAFCCLLVVLGRG
jgi:ergosteryl-3beta-O-L-aspartate synthase